MPTVRNLTLKKLPGVSAAVSLKVPGNFASGCVIEGVEIPADSADGLAAAYLAADGYAVFTDADCKTPVTGTLGSTTQTLYIGVHPNGDQHIVDTATGFCTGCGRRICYAVLTKSDSTTVAYPNIYDALKAAGNGDTVRVYADQTTTASGNDANGNVVDGAIGLEKSLTIDLMGKTWTLDGCWLYVMGGAAVTIQNGEIDRKFRDNVQLEGNRDATISVGSGKVTLSGLTVQGGSYTGSDGVSHAIYSLDILHEGSQANLGEGVVLKYGMRAASGHAIMEYLADDVAFYSNGKQIGRAHV